MSERISPQDEAAIRERKPVFGTYTFDRHEPRNQHVLLALPERDALLAELDVLRGEVERRDELLAGFVNVVDSCDLTVNDEENVGAVARPRSPGDWGGTQ